MRALKFLIPLAIFAGVALFLFKGVDPARDKSEIPSPLVGKPAPAFSLPLLADPSRNFSPDEMRGKVWLLNVWGSWCAACVVEHPVLNELARRGTVPIVGVAWKDKPEASKAWLAKHGDPYAPAVTDLDGRVAIDWGVYGAPETFVIDKAGVIRDKHIGPISAQALENRLMPLIARLKSE